MRGAVIYAPEGHPVRGPARPEHRQQPTDAIVRTVAACVCGSDLWRYRGIADVSKPTPIGHEYVGVVEAVGDDVTTVKPGQFVVGGFLTSDNTCALCRAGVHANCLNGTGYDGCQAELIRVQNADGTLIATPEQPDAELVPSLLALSDVMGTGWHAAVCADVQPGGTVVVVGDGAVGLSRRPRRVPARRGAGHRDEPARGPAALAREFGATDIVAERGDEGVERVQDLTGGIGADAVLECVGTHDSVVQALRSARPGAMVGWVGVPHVTRPAAAAHVLEERRACAAAPPRSAPTCPTSSTASGTVGSSRARSSTSPFRWTRSPRAYAAMDERRAIKTLLRP